LPSRNLGIISVLISSLQFSVFSLLLIKFCLS
jgi:hypothetical protein